MVGSGSGSTFKAFLGSARVRIRVGSVQHIYGSLWVRVRILGPVKTSNLRCTSSGSSPLRHRHAFESFNAQLAVDYPLLIGQNITHDNAKTCSVFSIKIYSGCSYYCTNFDI